LPSLFWLKHIILFYFTSLSAPLSFGILYSDKTCLMYFFLSYSNRLYFVRLGFGPELNVGLYQKL